MESNRYDIKEISEKDKDFTTYFDSDEWQIIGFHIENVYEYDDHEYIKKLNNGYGIYSLTPRRVFLFRKNKTDV